MQHIAANRCKSIKNCASKCKSMELYIKSVDNIRSQKPLRPTRWSLLLGILQTGRGLCRKKIFFFKSINTIYCWKAY